ncbi:MAG: hypothetical protein A3G34_06980 [Candidatus Lindowbacteria bacterium RIFCSPLOWO2_12_FULL_62_27]|nr:MAG: hypothetical protein A3G34_06980 [Candidatus Lindowbacteria bacterium RIFCSPLOWO2_12_FULL_62_27]OGH61288.1 MAG: hypothetical protein A3I06_03390 [Candidatus Lindowbacteria bacterium RIFCSPLOWO2_02_FULL_62_12]
MQSQILVVDDEKEITMLLTAALRMYKLEVVRFDNPVTALERITKEPYGLIVTDIVMPQMSGLDLVTKVRETDLNRGTPILVLSAKVLDDAERRQIFDHKCQYVKKPFVPREIIDIIRKTLVNEKKTTSVS